MSEIIPDPEQPTRLALDDDGNLLYGVFIRRIENPDAPSVADLVPAADWEHAGWTKGITTSLPPNLSTTEGES